MLSSEGSALAATREDLGRRGYRHQFTVAGERLLAVGEERTERRRSAFANTIGGRASRITDDMAIVYAIESLSGMSVTLVNAFGAYSGSAHERAHPRGPGAERSPC